MHFNLLQGHSTMCVGTGGRGDVVWGPCACPGGGLAPSHITPEGGKKQVVVKKAQV